MARKKTSVLELAESSFKTHDRPWLPVHIAHVRIFEVVGADIETRTGMVVEFKANMPYNSALRRAVKAALLDIERGEAVFTPIKEDTFVIGTINLDTLDVETT